MTTDQEVWSFLAAMRAGEIELEGQFLLGSNYTFLVNIHHNGQRYQAVYKPSRGEQPLWDFPEATLARREVAAYLVSQALGWCFVPLTILREEGPFGPGSLQRFISYDPNYHYFTFTEADKARLRPAAVFDLVINNADRKGSHLIMEEGTDKLWLIDHGLCFHEEDKLRTVIWDFAGEAIPAELLKDLERFSAAFRENSDLRTELARYISPREIAAIITRAQALVSNGTFPAPPEDRRAFPYPPL